MTKFKEIKPGMVIHCQTEEDAKALAQHLAEIDVAGYDCLERHYGEQSTSGVMDCISIHKNCSYVYASYGNKEWFEDNNMTITEFSDLIESEKLIQNSIDGIRFKDGVIKPDMVIHCPKEENVWELLKYLKSQGYKTQGIPAFDNCYVWIDEFPSVMWTGNEDKDAIEFYDLIESDPDEEYEMSAVEVLEWFREHECTETMFEVLECYSLDEAEERLSSEEIVDKITAYETAKKKPVEPELEWVNVCKVYARNPGLHECDADTLIATIDLPDGEKKNPVEKVIRKHIEKQKTNKYYYNSDEFYAIVERRCRVKEDNNK